MAAKDDSGVSRDALWQDFDALQFALGCPRVLDRLVGVDNNFKPVAGLGLGFGVRPVGHHRCPVPDRVGGPDHEASPREESQYEAWIPILFSKLASKMATGAADLLQVPIAAYVDSLAYHLDAGYLLAQVGLEAFSKRLVGADKTRLVKNKAEWRSFVEDHHAKIKALAASASDADILIDRLLEAQRRPTTGLVPRVLKDFGLQVPSSVLDEVKLRNTSAHDYLMSAIDPRDLHGDVRRRAIIQTVVAALVAKFVEYNGPICGFDRDEHGNEVVPDWWPFDESNPECLLHFRCTRR